MGERPDEIRRREALERRQLLDEGAHNTEPLPGRTGLDPAPDHLDAAAVDPRAFEEEPRIEVDEVEITRVGIEHTRADMSETVDAIQRKLNPDVLKEQARDRLNEARDDFAEQAKDRVHEATVGKAKHAGSDIVESVKQNPLPLALAGIGLGWLLANARKQSQVRPPTRPVRVHDGTAYAAGTYPPVYRNGEEEGRSVGQGLSNARDKVGETAGNAQDKVGEIAGNAQDKAEHIAGQVQDQAEHLGDRVRFEARRASGGFQRMLQENPLAVGALATGVGAAIGLAIPETAKEHEVMGEARDDLVEKTQEKVQETQQKVRQVAGEAQSAAQEAAQNQGLTQ